MKENEVSSSLHQKAILNTQEIYDMMAMRNQESKGYIEDLFHSIFLEHHSMLQQFLAPSFQGNLASLTLVFINVNFPNLVCAYLRCYFEIRSI